MSADNSIYIREFPNKKFAVKCISSLYPEHLTDEEIDKEFENLQHFETMDEAWEEVERIEDEYNKNDWPIEYGTEILERKS
jgi:hypothetical protein